MQINTILVCLYHSLVATYFSDDPKLNLGVVCNDQLVTRCGFKTLSEFFGPWNALQIGIGTGESSGRGAQLIETGVNPSSLRVYMIWQLLCEVLNSMGYLDIYTNRCDQ
jgi:hypothetical protein